MLLVIVLGIDRRVVDLFVMFFRDSGDRVFSEDPGKAVEMVMENLRKYSGMVKMYMRFYWGSVEQALTNPDLLIEGICRENEEVCERLESNREWFKQFLEKLYGELKEFMGK